MVENCFIGEYHYSIDAQRRLPLPRDWRGDAAVQFYLIPGRDCTIQVMPEAVFNTEILSVVNNVSFASSRGARALRRIGAKVHRCSCDRQGRITLTHELMGHAQLEEQAVLLGGFNSIHVMSPEAWTQDDVGPTGMLDYIEKAKRASGA